jgi:hypothetical protein
MTEERSIPISTRSICQNLRTKALYIPGGNLQNLAETNPFSDYWCNCTMTAVGPDDRFVSPEGCKTARSCFDPVGGKPLV